MSPVRLLKLSLVALLLVGCGEIATVSHTTPRLPAVANEAPELLAAEKELEKAKKFQTSEPTRALGGYLAAAQAASRQLERNAGDTRARSLYNFAVARCIEVIESAPLDPWSHSLSVPGPDGEYVVTTQRPAGPDRNPADYNITPVDSLSIGGAYFDKRVTVDGVGAPVVAAGREKKPSFARIFRRRAFMERPRRSSVLVIITRRLNSSSPSPRSGFRLRVIRLGSLRTSLPRLL